MKERILELLSSKDYVLMTRNAISAALLLKKGERLELRRALKELMTEGRVIRTDRRRYSLVAQHRSPGPQARTRDAGKLAAGVLKGHPRGFGFVIPDDKSVEDIYIHRENMSTALDGDKVLVRLFSPYGRGEHRNLQARRLRYGAGRGERRGPEGEIVEVVERSNKEIVGELRQSGHFYYVMPENRGIFQDIYISPEDLKGAKVGDRVVTKITEWESKHLNPEGTIVKVLGDSEDWRTDLASVMIRFGYRRTFPAETNAEAAAVPDEIGEEELARRRDLRGQVTFTIDPEDAKDFDDAISLERIEKGGWLLSVSIADVAYYVKEESELDLEARRRGNSVYLLNDVVPMLPRRLSSDLCSLKEGCDRLTKTVAMSFSKQGVLKEYEIFDSVITCKHRFSFKEVNDVLGSAGVSPAHSHGPAGMKESPYKEILEEMAELAGLLRGRRVDRGAVVFDMPEAKVAFGDDGSIAGVEAVRQGQSESLIEEFMLAANETVARHLRRHRTPTIYRVHDEPDSAKMEEFCQVARAFGYKLPKFPSREDVNRVIAEAQGRAESYLVNLAFLRSLKMAEYSVKNRGHYGLASKNYLHFTSPIRRYPDLVVHRCLDSLRDGAGKPERPGREAPEKEGLAEIAANCSETERRADAAEREVVEAATLRYLQGIHRREPGRLFRGVVTDVSRYEITVFLPEFLIDGSIRLKSLVGDFYRYDRKSAKLTGVRTRRTFQKGQLVKVTVRGVDVIRKELELDLVSGWRPR